MELGELSYEDVLDLLMRECCDDCRRFRGQYPNDSPIAYAFLQQGECERFYASSKRPTRCFITLMRALVWQDGNASLNAT